MKKLYAVLLACTMTISLAACSGGSPASQPVPTPSSSQSVSSQAVQSSAPAAPVQVESAASAVASEPAATLEPALESSEAVPEESSEAAPTEQEAGKALVVYFSWSGNTESVAQGIQSQTGADIFELAPATPYTDNYNDLLDIAQQEQRSNARPAISGNVDLSSYDTIYLGYPNWWADMPMLVYTFLDDYDLSGKTVAPFCTSGGSGFSGTMTAIRSAEPNATVLEGLHIGSDSASNPTSAITRWLNGHGQ